MRSLLFHPGVDAGILEYSAKLSVLLTGLVGMVGGAAARIDLLTYRHAGTPTPAGLGHSH
jgi:hypothetical protein